MAALRQATDPRLWVTIVSVRGPIFLLPWYRNIHGQMVLIIPRKMQSTRAIFLSPSGSYDDTFRVPRPHGMAVNNVLYSCVINHLRLVIDRVILEARKSGPDDHRVGGPSRECCLCRPPGERVFPFWLCSRARIHSGGPRAT
jgi:hypothetical protein